MALDQIQEILISQITLVPLLRKEIDEEKLTGLMQSIQEVGLLVGAHAPNLLYSKGVVTVYEPHAADP